MFSLDCEEMNVLRPNDWITMSYYYILFVWISNVITFCQKSSLTKVVTFDILLDNM